MPSPLLSDIQVLRSWLDRHHILPQHSSGQNFLISPEVVGATIIVAKAGPRYVTELGAGAGTVTQALAGEGFTVRAIERDSTLAKILPAALPLKLRASVSVVAADLRQTPWFWDTGYQVIGNIPYNLSGLILRRITQLDPAPAQVILLLQKEVGEQLTAAPPNMRLVSVAVQLWGQAHKLLDVPRHCFWPAPQVDSQLLLLIPHPDPLLGKEREDILKLAKTFFQQRRKQIGGVLRRARPLTEPQLTELLATADVLPTSRPQELTVTQWQRLHDILG